MPAASIASSYQCWRVSTEKDDLQKPVDDQQEKEFAQLTESNRELEREAAADRKDAETLRLEVAEANRLMAEAKLELEKVKERTLPRRLRREQSQLITKSLQRSKLSAAVNVFRYLGSDDSVLSASEIGEAIKKAKWSVARTGQHASGAVLPGVKVSIPDVEAAKKAGNALVSALKSAQLAVHVLRCQEDEALCIGQRLTIFVGSRE